MSLHRLQISPERSLLLLKDHCLSSCHVSHQKRNGVGSQYRCENAILPIECDNVPSQRFRKKQHRVRTQSCPGQSMATLLNQLYILIHQKAPESRSGIICDLAEPPWC